MVDLFTLRLDGMYVRYASKHCNLLEEADIAEIKSNQSSSHTSVLEFKEESKQVDAVIASLVVALDPGEPNPNEILNFKSNIEPNSNLEILQS